MPGHDDLVARRGQEHHGRRREQQGELEELHA
jgi:hypothetical protein